MALIVNLVAIRWSRAANTPIRSCRLRVGWPRRIRANGDYAELTWLGRGGMPEMWRMCVVRLMTLKRRRTTAKGCGPSERGQVLGRGHSAGRSSRRICVGWRMAASTDEPASPQVSQLIGVWVVIV